MRASECAPLPACGMCSYSDASVALRSSMALDFSSRKLAVGIGWRHLRANIKWHVAFDIPDNATGGLLARFPFVRVIEPESRCPKGGQNPTPTAVAVGSADT